MIHSGPVTTNGRWAAVRGGRLFAKVGGLVLFALLVSALLAVFAFEEDLATSAGRPADGPAASDDQVPFREPFQDSGGSADIAAARQAIAALITSWDALFRIPPAAAAQQRSALRRTLSSRSAAASALIAPGSPAEVLYRSSIDQMVDAQTALTTYSDNEFTVSTIVGVDASDPQDIIVVVHGSKRFLINAGSIRQGGWEQGEETQWQVRLRRSPSGGLQITDLVPRSLPTKPVHH